jgi:hypothetical protein
VSDFQDYDRKAMSATLVVRRPRRRGKSNSIKIPTKQSMPLPQRNCSTVKIRSSNLSQDAEKFLAQKSDEVGYFFDRSCYKPLPREPNRKQEREKQTDQIRSLAGRGGATAIRTKGDRADDRGSHNFHRVFSFGMQREEIPTKALPQDPIRANLRSV